MLGSVVSVVGGFECDRRHVSAVPMKAAVVEPVDPFGGGQLDLLDRAPRLTRLDQLGLVEPVDRLGQSVVVTVADCADRGVDAGCGQTFGKASDVY